MIPSVALVNEIPTYIAGSWYNGNVYVSLKDAVFEPSSPMRHMAKLSSLLNTQPDQKRFLLLYTDGGPDHWVTSFCSASSYCNFQIAGSRLPLCSVHCTVSLMAQSSGKDYGNSQPRAAVCGAYEGEDG